MWYFLVQVGKHSPWSLPMKTLEEAMTRMRRINAAYRSHGLPVRYYVSIGRRSVCGTN